MVRKPVVAGKFYPENKEELFRQVRDLMPGERPARKVVGAVVPHAGYVYSGGIAGRTFSEILFPSTIVLLGPNHTGFGAPLAVFPSGFWETPLGKVRVDASLTDEIVRTCPGAIADDRAHRFEHSLEVLVPFIQVRSPESSIVSICVGQNEFQELVNFGDALGDLLVACSSDVLLVASSDMTHFESAERARKQDSMALKTILDLDPEGLYRVVMKERISMCGVFPTVAMLCAALKMNASRGVLIQYGNSGEVTGEMNGVVGYAGVIVEKGAGEESL
ncbi:MAG: AmmeMemoRadiSam system protein B [Syntrophotaleaceae bacterium]